MDERYAAIYEEMYARRTQPTLSAAADGVIDSRIADIVRGAVDSAEIEQLPGRRLRADAKALLAVNFQEMVILALSLGGVPYDALESDVRADIATLVSDATADEPDFAGPQEVSGHAVIDSLSRNWDQLRISRFRLWERS